MIHEGHAARGVWPPAGDADAMRPSSSWSSSWACSAPSSCRSAPRRATGASRRRGRHGVALSGSSSSRRAASVCSMPASPSCASWRCPALLGLSSLAGPHGARRPAVAAGVTADRAIIDAVRARASSALGVLLAVTRSIGRSIWLRRRAVRPGRAGRHRRRDQPRAGASGRRPALLALRGQGRRLPAGPAGDAPRVARFGRAPPVCRAAALARGRDRHRLRGQRGDRRSRPARVARRRARPARGDRRGAHRACS